VPELAARALEICLDRCDFADAILYSDTPVVGRFRHERIEKLKSIADYSHFCLRVMPVLIDTPFVLVIQWDGYVVDPGAWANAFRKYDYIGGVIHQKQGNVVGNGGFSLRSRKLLKALPSLPGSRLNEDMVICQMFRKTLETDFGIRFAPEKIAERFSYEDQYPGKSTFGFHAAPNFWRHESDEEVLRVCTSMRESWLTSFFFYGLLQESLSHGRVALARSLYGLARQTRSAAGLKTAMAPSVSRQQVALVLDLLEQGHVGN
jgi:hypothetical protein